MARVIAPILEKALVLKCISIPDLADDYLDRDGPLAGRIGVALHLSVCGHCRAYVRGLSVTKRLAAESLRAEAPETVLDRIGMGRGDREEGSTL